MVFMCFSSLSLRMIGSSESGEKIAMWIPGSRPAALTLHFGSLFWRKINGSYGSAREVMARALSRAITSVKWV